MSVAKINTAAQLCKINSAFMLLFLWRSMLSFLCEWNALHKQTSIGLALPCLVLPTTSVLHVRTYICPAVSVIASYLSVRVLAYHPAFDHKTVNCLYVEVRKVFTLLPDSISWADEISPNNRHFKSVKRHIGSRPQNRHAYIPLFSRHLCLGR